MILLNWLTMKGQIGSIMGRYNQLPRHIAKKHLKAAARRAAKAGVPVLKALTPKGGKRTRRNAVTRNARGQFEKGSGKIVKVRGGALRRSVTAKSKYIGRNRDGVVYAVVGYKAGLQSRKAIWLEFGTNSGIEPKKIMDRFRRTYKGPAMKELKKELLVGLERATRELASGKNPGRT